MTRPSRIGQTPFLSLVPASIAGDEGIRRIAGVLDAPLSGVVHSIPRLLLWARLHPDPALLSPVMRRLAEAAGGLQPLSEAELELLAWQLHVDFRETAKTRERLAEMVRQSIPWHRIKGTPASLQAALALFGIDAAIEEGGPRWATYQLGLGGVEDVETVRTAVRVAQEMAPVRCRLFRVYNDAFDRRPLVPTAGPAVGEGYLSHFSGVEVPGAGDALVSLGGRLTAFSPARVPAGFVGWHELHTLFARRLKSFIVGLSRLSDVYGMPKPFIFANLFSLLAEHEREERGFGVSRRAKAQAVLSEAWDALGGSNFRLGTTWRTLPSTPFSLGLSALSGADGRSRRIRLDEVLAETAGFTAARGERPEPVCFSWEVTDQFFARRMTRFIVGLSPLSDVFVENKPFVFDGLLSLGAEHERRARAFGTSCSVKAQALLSEAWDALGGSNFRLGVAWGALKQASFVLGASLLSGKDGWSRRIRVDEARRETETVFAEPRRERPTGGICGLSALVSLRTGERCPRLRWTHEPWAHRRWWNRIAFVNLKQEEETI